MVLNFLKVFDQEYFCSIFAPRIERRILKNNILTVTY